tara:strand:- start:2002 stop:2982 length:981 start_codon:yes stop_codon:yes gene_type:complete
MAAAVNQNEYILNNDFLVNHFDLINYNYEINTRDKSVYSLIGILPIEIDDNPIGTVKDYVKNGKMTNAEFALYDESGKLDHKNLQHQNYIKFSKLIHNIGENISEVATHLDSIQNSCVEQIKEKLREILETRNSIILEFTIFQKQLKMTLTYELLIKFLFGKGVSRASFFIHSKNKISDLQLEKGDENLYMSIILITLQVFSDGNHRTGFKYFKGEYMDYKEFNILVEGFRSQFIDHYYDYYNEINGDKFFDSFVDSFSKYKMLKGPSNTKNPKKSNTSKAAAMIGGKKMKKKTAHKKRSKKRQSKKTPIKGKFKKSQKNKKKIKR